MRPPDKLLLRCIGGPRDGEWVEHAMRDPECRFARTIQPSYKLDDPCGPPAAIEVAYDRYTLRQFYADGATQQVLGWDKLPNRDLFFHMLRNWTPRQS